MLGMFHHSVGIGGHGRHGPALTARVVEDRNNLAPAVTCLQGKFKRPISAADLWVGQELWNEPLLPERYAAAELSHLSAHGNRKAVQEAPNIVEQVFLCISSPCVKWHVSYHDSRLLLAIAPCSSQVRQLKVPSLLASCVCSAAFAAWFSPQLQNSSAARAK